MNFDNYYYIGINQIHLFKIHLASNFYKVIPLKFLQMMKSINKNKLAFLLLLAFLYQIPFFSSLCAQDFSSNTKELPAPLFQSDEPLFLTLSMDIKTVIRDIEEKESHPAEISYTDQEGKEVKLPIKIKLRGNFRKDPVNCDFPPLRLNFSSTSVINTVFAGQDKIKLVTHCRSRKDLYEQNVLEEYLAYELYNLFTEESYLVRLVHLTYADTEGKIDTLEKMAFLIEPNQQMARRNDCELLKVKKIAQERTARQNMNVLSVFQYMIGNTDWSVSAMHNVVFLKEDPAALPIVVPYDFDWCGLVNAPYAVPAEHLPIESVSTRLYRGYCRPDAELQLVLDEFRQRREEIYHTCKSVPFLEEKDLNKIIKYMDQFFKTIENPKAVEVAFHQNCRTK